MSLNQNGLYNANWQVVQSYTSISEGAVVGISFGWIIGVIGLYILGVVLICKCVRNRKDEDSDDEKQKKEKDSKESRGLQINLQKRKKYEQKESTDNIHDLPRKRIPENLHTQLEMMDSDKPSQPQSITYKLKKERQS